MVLAGNVPLNMEPREWWISRIPATVDRQGRDRRIRERGFFQCWTTPDWPMANAARSDLPIFTSDIGSPGMVMADVAMMASCCD